MLRQYKYLFGKTKPSGHTTLKQRRFNVDATSLHWINVELTVFNAVYDRRFYNVVCLLENTSHIGHSRNPKQSSEDSLARTFAVWYYIIMAFVREKYDDFFQPRQEILLECLLEITLTVEGEKKSSYYPRKRANIVLLYRTLKLQLQWQQWDHQRVILPCTWNVLTITKTRLLKYIENFTIKNWKFSDKNSNTFSTFLLNLCFWAEIRKIMYTPVNPSFTTKKKWGLRGWKLYRYVFVMRSDGRGIYEYYMRG